MPFDSDKRSKEAKRRLRDANGHFTSLKPKVKVSGQANLVKEFVDTSGNPDSDSMIGFYVKDPFKKFVKILEEIKNKQSTKVNLSFTIPIVALPIVILLAFQFGRYQSSCNDYFSSQVGTLQNITVTKTITVIPESFFLRALSYIPYTSDLYKKEVTISQPILMKQNDEGVLIDNTASLNLKPFDQAKVIVFGNYNSCAQTLSLDSDKNISNY